MMQGDAYNLGFTIRNNAGSAVTPEDVINVEITIGNLTKTFQNGDVTYLDGKWYFPLTQAETFQFRPSAVKAQVRIKWANGVVEGKPAYGVRIHESRSKEVL